MSEYLPEPPSIAEIAAQLATGHLDTSLGLGNVATRIIVKRPDGVLVAPLRCGIDVVDDNDGEYMQKLPVTINEAKPTDDAETPELTASWIGTDDQLRTAPIATEEIYFEPNYEV